MQSLQENGDYLCRIPWDECTFISYNPHELNYCCDLPGCDKDAKISVSYKHNMLDLLFLLCKKHYFALVKKNARTHDVVFCIKDLYNE